MLPRAILLLVIAGCGPDVSVSKAPVDADGDGYDDTVDGDDGRADVNPTAPELCDGRANACDSEVDEEPVDGTPWYADGDTHGDPAAGVVA